MLSYIIRLIFFISFLLVISCSGSVTRLDTLNEELFSEEQVILCPDVKFIEGMDRLTVKEENRDLYILKFYEVRWKCYSNIDDKYNVTDNIDLSIRFNVDYLQDQNDFKTEKFSFIIALLNKDNKIITKEKFNRTFLSMSKSEIISDNEALINIKVNNSQDNIYNHKLLLGFSNNKKD